MGKVIAFLLFASLALAQYNPPSTGGGGGGGGSTPCGSTTQIQYNNAGACGASPNFTVNLATGGFVEKSHSALGNAGVIDGATPFQPTSQPSNLYTKENIADVVASGAYSGLLEWLNVTDATPGAATGVVAAQLFVTTEAASGNLDTAAGSNGIVNHGSTATITNAYGLNGLVFNSAGGTITRAYGSQNLVENDDGNIANAYGYDSQVFNEAAGEITLGYGYRARAANEGGGTFPTYYAYYSDDLGPGLITNPYYDWFDSRGVLRVKEDSTFNGVGQAIQALYNPQFTKYTPGAANYERIVLGQWNSNVSEIGNQAGGTGTLRRMRFIGVSVEIPSSTFAALATPTDATEVYCSDCAVVSGINNTCAGSGTGAFAQRINGAWKCTI